MPKINVDHNTKLNTQEAFAKIKEFFETDETLKKLDSKIHCTFDASKLSGSVKGSQFKAEVAVKSSGAGSQVSVMVDLPLLLTPFKGKVQETIERKLGKYLA